MTADAAPPWGDQDRRRMSAAILTRLNALILLDGMSETERDWANFIAFTLGRYEGAIARLERELAEANEIAAEWRQRAESTAAGGSDGEFYRAAQATMTGTPWGLAWSDRDGVLWTIDPATGKYRNDAGEEWKPARREEDGDGW